MKSSKGVEPKVKIDRRIIASLVLAVFAALAVGCGGGGDVNSPNETAAKVNGQAITMEQVDRAVKQQAQGQEAKMSPLELASARLQILDTLIQQEVMYQKAQKEGTVPSDDDVTGEINKEKTASGKTADQIAKDMADAGITDAALREQIKKKLATDKLVEKITGKIEPPKDSEIDAFYNGNKDAFVKKKGVKLGAIVIDPTNSGEGDQTTDEQSAVLKANEIIGKLKAGQDFATLAREYSEDQSKLQSGDLGFIAQDDLVQAFNDQVAAQLMSPQQQIGGVITSRSQGKLFILKLQERNDKDEPVTLESPGVRQQVIDSLLNSRKQLLAASYQAIAMNEAKIENFLAKKVVDNPNELSGARPAGASSSTPAATNTNSNAAPVATNTAPANTNTATKAAANNAANSKPAATKPAATPAVKPAAPANK